MEKRAEKYVAKLSGDNRKRAYDSQKKQMSRLEKEATEELVKIEEVTKQIVQGESLLHIPYYIIFAKELYSLMQKHKDKTLINEAIILEEKWKSRGLNDHYLSKIKKYYIQEYKEIFRLDISALDGLDVMG